MVVIKMLFKSAAKACVRIGSDLRTALRTLVRFLAEMPRLLGFVYARLMKREVWHDIGHTLLTTVGLFAAGGLVLLAKGRIREGCAYIVCCAWVLPLALIGCVIVSVMGSDRTVYAIVIGLCVTGLAVQLVLDAGNAAAIVLHLYTAALCAVVAAATYYFLCMLDAHTMVSLLTTLSMAAYTALFCLGTAVHSTRAWLGGVQVTEITKIFFALSLARASTEPERTDRERTETVFKLLIIHMVGLAAANEFSTLLILVLCTGVTLFLAVKDLRWTAVWLGIIAGCGYVGYEVCGICASLGGKGVFKLIYRKISNRLTGGGDGFQAARAAKALVMSGWFGSDQIISVPAAKTDMVLISVAQLCGAAAVIGITLAFSALLVWGLVSASRRKSDFPSIVSLSCLFQIVAQFVCNAVSEFGGPIMGVGVPFVSLGGTNLACCAFCMGLALAASSRMRARESQPFH